MVDVIPKLFITGSEYRIIVTDRSCDDLCDSNQLSKDELSFNKIKWIHSLDSTRLIANMFRYANGQSLNIPKYLSAHHFGHLKIKLLHQMNLLINLEKKPKMIFQFSIK